MRDLTTLKTITEDWEDSRRDVANKICRKLIKIADKKDKEIEDFTLRDIKDALLLREGEYLTNSKGFMNVVLNIIKEIYLSLGVVIDYKIEDFTDIISDELQGFYVKSEIIDICNLFINVQDKLIIYGLFVGMNKDDLVNLKREDLDFKKKTIKLSDKFIKMDEYMEDILKDITDDRFCNYYHTNINEENKPTTITGYKLNPLNPYLIKPKPSSKNDYGIGAMKATGFRTRLEILSKASGYKLLANKIVRSGIMYRMRLIRRDWKANEIKQYLKVHNISGQFQEIYRIYNLRYK